MSESIVLLRSLLSKKEGKKRQKERREMDELTGYKRNREEEVEAEVEVESLEPAPKRQRRTKKKKKNKKNQSLLQMGFTQQPQQHPSFRKPLNLPNPSYRDIYDPESVPAGSIDLLYMDPLWMYGSKKPSSSSWAGQASRHYPVMTIAEIGRLPINRIANPNGCVLLMWVTGPKLFEAKELMVLWGFTYITVFMNWHKTNRDGSLRKWGLGAYNRGAAEWVLLGAMGPNQEDVYSIPAMTVVGNRLLLDEDHYLLLARKGSIYKYRNPDRSAVGTNVLHKKERVVDMQSIILESSPRHSAKPLLMYDRISKAFPGAKRKIELFSRCVESQKGWLCWGNECLTSQKNFSILRTE